MAFSNLEIVDFIRAAMKSRGSSVAYLEKSLGFANGTIGKWAKAPKSPPYAKLAAVADALGVTLETLTGQKEKAPTLEVESGRTDEIVTRIIQIVRQLDVETQELCLQYFETLLATQQSVRREPDSRG